MPPSGYSVSIQVANIAPAQPVRPSSLNPRAKAYDPRKGTWSGEAKDVKKMASHAALALLMPTLLVPGGVAPSEFTSQAQTAESMPSPQYRVGEVVVAHGLICHTELNRKKGRVRAQVGGMVQVDFQDDKRTLSTSNLRPATMDDDEIEVVDVDDEPIEVHGPFPIPRQPVQPVPFPSDETLRLAAIQQQRSQIEQRLAALRAREVDLTAGMLPDRAPSPPPLEEEEEDVPPPLLDDDYCSDDSSDDASIIAVARMQSPVWSASPVRRGGTPSSSDLSSQGISPEVSPRSCSFDVQGYPFAKLLPDEVRSVEARCTF